jgi:hypothetical protein
MPSTVFAALRGRHVVAPGHARAVVGVHLEDLAIEVVIAPGGGKAVGPSPAGELGEARIELRGGSE